MTHDEILKKVDSIINSCVSYAQLKNCQSFINNRYVCRGIGDMNHVLVSINKRLKQLQAAENIEQY